MNELSIPKKRQGITTCEQITVPVGVLSPSLRVARVLPVKVQTVEVVLSNEVDGRLDELLPDGPVRDHVRVLLDPFVPAAGGDHHLQSRVRLPQLGHALVAS